MNPVEQADLDAAVDRVNECRINWEAAGGQVLEADAVQKAMASEESWRRAVHADKSLLNPIYASQALLYAHLIPLRKRIADLGIDWYFVPLFAGAVTFGLTLLILALVLSNFALILCVGLITWLLSTAVVAILWLVPSDLQALAFCSWWVNFQRDKNERREKLGQAETYRAWCVELDRVQRELVEAESDRNKVLAAFTEARNQLRLSNWRALRDVEFEMYLGRVLEVCGYHVERKGGPGDQGVDLVAKKGIHKLAIQAKGYFNSVDNSAVQQVHAGMSFHGCTACVVITNSRFTRGAVELAASINCTLIGEDRFLELIEGKIL